MTEVYNWREGSIHLWTGSATASAVIAFAQNLMLTPAWGMQSDPTLGGGYRQHLTGRRADLIVQALYTHDGTLARLAGAATAGGVHMKLINSGIHGSAGYLLWSGSIDALPWQGSEVAPFSYQLAYHCHEWSAFP